QSRRRGDLRRYAALALTKGKGPHVSSADADPAAGGPECRATGNPRNSTPARAAIARADGSHARVPFRPRAENALPAWPDDDGRDLELARSSHAEHHRARDGLPEDRAPRRAPRRRRPLLGELPVRNYRSRLG